MPAHSLDWLALGTWDRSHLRHHAVSFDWQLTGQHTTLMYRQQC